MSVFWKKALSIMEDHQLRKKDLIDGIGVPGSTFHTWIKKDKVPPADDAVKIADKLGVSVTFLVTGDNEQELTPQEKRLLDLCKELPSEKMEAVITVAKTLKRDIDRERGDVSPGSSASEAV